MRSLKMILAAARRLAHQWRVMIVLALVYAALLAALFFFVATTEATAGQIFMTLCFAALAPVLFFLLQAMIVNYARGETKTLSLLRHSFRDSCKLALASLPLALTIFLLLYFSNKLQSPAHVWTPQATPPGMWPPPRSPQSDVDPIASLQWSQLAWTTLRFLLCYVALPLVVVHLWNAIVRDGFLRAVKRTHHHLARAFAPDAVLTYALGLLLFGLVPHGLIFMHTPAAKPSIEIGLMVARLLLAFVFTLFGWVLTFDALAGAGDATAAGVEAVTS